MSDEIPVRPTMGRKPLADEVRIRAERLRAKAVAAYELALEEAKAIEAAAEVIEKHNGSL